MPDFTQFEDSYRRYALYEKGHRQTTVKQTLAVVRQLVAHLEAESPLGIETAEIRDFLQRGRERNGWTAKTFRIYRQYLKTFYDWGVSQRWIAENPVILIQSPRLPAALPRCLSKEQALKVLAHVEFYPWHYELERSRNKAIVATFLYTGIRLSELLNLRGIDVNLDQSEMRILAGKNEKDRLLPLHPALVPILRDYQRARRALAKASPWFFASVRSEKRLTVKNLHLIFHRVSQQSRIKVTPHMLRHTFGRLSVESNISMRIIQRMMGHASIHTTQTYTFVSTYTMRKAINESRFL